MIGRGRSSSAASTCFERFGDLTGIALGLHGLAFARPAGAELEALAQSAESLTILRGLGDRRNVAKVLVIAADINADLGDLERVRPRSRRR